MNSKENYSSTIIKTSSLLMFIFLFLTTTYGQPTPFIQSLDKYQIIDTAKYVVTYRLSFIKDAESMKENNDIIILEIGNKYSKSYSSTLFEADSTAAEWIKKGSNVIPRAKQSVPLEDIYKNHKSKKSTNVFRSILSGPVYQYEENSNLMAWEIQPEKKSIYSYTCQKATTSFRGREYEAWFTNDIPLNDGPWKFGGLPGLILFVKDTQSHYIFECIGIEKTKKPHTIKLWSWKYQNIKYEQLQKMKKRMYLNTYNYCISIGQEIGGDHEEAKKKMNYPYNPIELK